MNSVFNFLTKGDRSPLYSVLGSFFLTLLVIVIGSWIPFPFLNGDLISYFADLPSDKRSQLSIIALGISPFFTVLQLVEIVKLIFPRLDKWQLSRDDNAYRMNVAVNVLVILVTAIQGYGVISALTAVGSVDVSASTMFVGILTYVAMSVVIIWLANLNRLPGIESGIWVLAALYGLMALPTKLTDFLAAIQAGSIQRIEGLAFVVVMVIAILLIGVGNRLILAVNSAGNTSSIVFSSILLWPPFVVNALVAFLLGILFLALPETKLDVSNYLIIARVIVLPILIPLIVYAYYRRFSICYPDLVNQKHVRLVLFWVASIQVIISVGFGVLASYVSSLHMPSVGFFISTVTVLFAFGVLLRRFVSPER
ncbi:MAG TPA: hypothetical protein VN150_10700 [Ochrobactrum sp.]|nr:hypothetical protein [Ochrobactrum sp.]